MLKKILKNQDTTNNINDDISKLRIFLHSTIYLNEEKINYLLKIINDNMILFYSNYNSNSKSIELKIKKTTINISNDETLRSYYYNILNYIFCEFFEKNLVYLNSINSDCINLEYLINLNTISSIYNITILSDNIIKIYL